MAKSKWPFEDAPNVATITVHQVVRGGQPILLVARDADDGGWQFLTGGPFDVADALVVSLGSMVGRDPTLGELADLPPGWQAVRPRVGAAWRRGPQPEE